jgi:hypothetical protein
VKTCDVQGFGGCERQRGKKENPKRQAYYPCQTLSRIAISKNLLETLLPPASFFVASSAFNIQILSGLLVPSSVSEKSS